MRSIPARSGPPVGPLSGITYASQPLVLAPNASLLLYTDGVTEAMDSNDLLYGDQRLERFYAAHAQSDCQSTLTDLLADIRQHACGAEQSDDITVLMLRRFVPPTN